MIQGLNINFDSQILKNKFWRNDFAGIQDLGYYPCYEIILLDVQICEPCGMNMALPLESLCVICLGYMPHLVQGLSSARKLKLDAETEDAIGAHYVFGEQNKRESQCEHKVIHLGELLQKQPDLDKPKTVFNSFLVNPDPKQQ